MVKKVIGWGITLVVLLAVGGYMQDRGNARDAGKATAHIVNEGGDAGEGIIAGVVTFARNLDF